MQRYFAPSDDLPLLPFMYDERHILEAFYCSKKKGMCAHKARIIFSSNFFPLPFFFRVFTSIEAFSFCAAQQKKISSFGAFGSWSTTCRRPVNIMSILCIESLCQRPVNIDPSRSTILYFDPLVLCDCPSDAVLSFFFFFEKNVKIRGKKCLGASFLFQQRTMLQCFKSVCPWIFSVCRFFVWGEEMRMEDNQSCLSLSIQLSPGLCVGSRTTYTASISPPFFWPQRGFLFTARSVGAYCSNKNITTECLLHTLRTKF